ncbi:hypothetical protein [Nocardioides sp.]|uniref:hypothetical protein n=1 Tax=Nocardioides sp. TaxID=35761 RepID=UPI0039E2C9B8
MRQTLLDLTDDVAVRIHVDPAAAWARARRRTVRRRVGAALVAAVAVVLVVVGLRSLDPRPVALDPADHGSGGLGLPTRLGHQWLSHTLDNGDRPGAAAGLVHRQGVGWYLVLPSGRLVGLLANDDTTGEYPPAISPDGRRVAFMQLGLADDASRLVVAELDTGQMRFLSTVDAGRTRDGVPTNPLAEHRVNGQSPMRFSPDGSHLIVLGGASAAGGPEDGRAVLIGVADGVVTTVTPAGSSLAMPAGWLDDDHLVWIDGEQRQGLVTDLTGTVVQRARLGEPSGVVMTPTAEVDPSDWAQWVGPVSPDGVTVAGGVVPTSGDLAQAVVTYRIRVGETWPGSTNVGTSHLASLCPLSWGEDEMPALPRDAPELLGGEDMVVADASLHIDCSIWAGDALDGPRHRGLTGRLFGYQTAWFYWWWRELLLGAAALAGVLLLGRRRLRSRV